MNEALNNCKNGVDDGNSNNLINGGSEVDENNDNYFYVHAELEEREEILEDSFEFIMNDEEEIVMDADNGKLLPKLPSPPPQPKI